MAPTDQPLSGGQPLWKWGLAGLGLSLLLAVRVMGSFGAVVPSDAHGYEAASVLLGKGQLPYFNFIHSHGPIFLVNGVLAQGLTGGAAWGFHAEALVVSLLAMALMLDTLRRVGSPLWVAMVSLAALWMTPPALTASSEFLGLAELVLGAAFCLREWLVRDQPRPWMLGLGMAYVMANKWMGAPWVGGVWIALLIWDRKKAIQTLAFSLGFWALFMGWTWFGEGFAGWRAQTLSLHAGKQAHVFGMEDLLKHIALQLAPWVWAVLWLAPHGAPKARNFALASLGLYGLGMTTQPFLAFYYLLPALVSLFYLTVTLPGKSISKFMLGLAWAPLVISTLLSLQPLAGREPSPVLPGYGQACETVKAASLPGAAILVDSPIAYPVLNCSNTTSWESLVDTNLYIFQRLMSLETLQDRLVKNPPIAVVLLKGQRLGRIDAFLHFLNRHFRPLAQPKESAFLIWEAQ